MTKPTIKALAKYLGLSEQTLYHKKRTRPNEWALLWAGWVEQVEKPVKEKIFKVAIEQGNSKADAEFAANNMQGDIELMFEFLPQTIGGIVKKRKLSSNYELRKLIRDGTFKYSDLVSFIE